MTLKEPVSFRIMGSDSDEIEVKVVFLLGCSDGEEHIQVLQKIVELVQQQAFLDQLLQLQTVEEAYQLLESNLDL